MKFGSNLDYFLKGIPVYANKVARGPKAVSIWISANDLLRFAEGALRAARAGGPKPFEITVHDGKATRSGRVNISLNRHASRKTRIAAND